jgi:tRNA pseudouridine55 synthase
LRFPYRKIPGAETMAGSRQVSGPDGLLVIDKPEGMTSRRALDRAGAWFARGTRTGHTGTLDPGASGVLVLCLGSATRLAEYVQRMAKTYRSTFHLGARSTTDDADGTISPVDGVSPPGLEAVAAAVAGFVGRIEQVPPAFSAAKVSGQRAYDLARAGRHVDLAARTIEVYGIDILRYDYPALDLEVRCGKGTYIRALARDVGTLLGCGAYIQTLRRTQVGPFRASDAVALTFDAELARTRLLPPQAALVELARVALADDDAERLAHGGPVALPLDAEDGSELAVFDAAGRLYGVARVDAPRKLMVPIKVLPRT